MYVRTYLAETGLGFAHVGVILPLSPRTILNTIGRQDQAVCPAKCPCRHVPRAMLATGNHGHYGSMAKHNFHCRTWSSLTLPAMEISLGNVH